MESKSSLEAKRRMRRYLGLEEEADFEVDSLKVRWDWNINRRSGIEALEDKTLRTLAGIKEARESLFIEGIRKRRRVGGVKLLQDGDEVVADRETSIGRLASKTDDKPVDERPWKLILNKVDDVRLIAPSIQNLLPDGWKKRKDSSIYGGPNIRIMGDEKDKMIEEGRVSDQGSFALRFDPRRVVLKMGNEKSEQAEGGAVHVEKFKEEGPDLQNIDMQPTGKSSEHKEGKRTERDTIFGDGRLGTLSRKRLEGSNMDGRNEEKAEEQAPRKPHPRLRAIVDSWRELPRHSRVRNSMTVHASDELSPEERAVFGFYKNPGTVDMDQGLLSDDTSKVNARGTLAEQELRVVKFKSIHYTISRDKTDESGGSLLREFGRKRGFSLVDS